jgi:Glucan phosphorylase
LPEALEKWGVDLFGNLLPRHLEIIYLINHFFLERMIKRFPGDWEKIARLSLIEESNPKMVRMANLVLRAFHLLICSVLSEPIP